MEEERKPVTPIAALRPGMENVRVRVRVLEAGSPKTVETRRGLRTLSEAVVGDGTGRVRLTLWGRLAGTLRDGEAVEIEGAWTTSYRGFVILNAGSRSRVRRVDDASVPEPERVPDKFPRAGPSRAARGRRR